MSRSACDCRFGMDSPAQAILSQKGFDSVAKATPERFKSSAIVTSVQVRHSAVFISAHQHCYFSRKNLSLHVESRHLESRAYRQSDSYGSTSYRCRRTREERRLLQVFDCRRIHVAVVVRRSGYAFRSATLVDQPRRRYIMRSYL